MIWPVLLAMIATPGGVHGAQNSEGSHDM